MLPGGSFVLVFKKHSYCVMKWGVFIVKYCDVWLNGKLVGTVELDPKSCMAEIRCSLREGWIYRAVLLSEGREIFRFGVLMPRNGMFMAQGSLPELLKKLEERHCEVLRSLPGETCIEGQWLTKSQLQPWIPGVFPLDRQISLLVEKKYGGYYRIYNHTRYLLFPIETKQEDPLVEIYCVGKPICLGDTWYLCFQVNDEGKIIPWGKDEN